MKRRDAAQDHTSFLFVIVPVGIVDLNVGCSVVHFPIFQCRHTVINPELLRKKAVHQSDGHRIRLCHTRRRTQKSLLQFVLILLCPGIMISDNTDGGVDAVASMGDLIGKHGAITVTDHICAPFFRHFQSQFFIS